MTEETLFAEALAKPSEERSAFLDEACGDDAELRERVEQLLRSSEEAGSFLAQSAAEDFDATLDISVDEQALIAARSADLKKSQAARSEPTPAEPEQKSDDHEPPSVTVKKGAYGERILYFGDYELQGEIARGAMGVVYRAEQSSLKRIVAIKMIRSTLLTNEMDVTRFKAEAEAAASLDHPNIVPIYEVGMHEEQHYFTMKLIEGGTLRDHLERLQNDPKAAAKLMSTVAGAIHAAHQRGILHRDLKPGNILVDEDGKPHVTDFGLAKQMESNSSVTLSGQIMGTPQYMAPEQAEGGGKDLTTAADVYALGAIFYEMLCGKPPHVGDSLMDTLKLVAEGGAAPPSKHNPKVDRDLETIAMKCLEKDPAKRYASAQGLKNDLDHWLAGEPIEARPVGNAEKVIKWMKRKPMHAAAAVLAVLFLLTLGVGGPVAAFRQEKLRELAVEATSLALDHARSNRIQSYSAHLKLASGAIDDHDLVGARRLLKRHVPQPREEDVRGFEWRHLWNRTHSEELRIVGGYGGGRGGVAVSVDGRMIAYNEAPGIVVLPTAGGQPIGEIDTWNERGEPHNGLLCFSPDGRFLISSTTESTRRWRIGSGDFEEDAEVVSMGFPLAFASAGSLMVSQEEDRLTVWDSRKWEKIAELPGRMKVREKRARKYKERNIVISADERFVFAAEEKRVRCWDLKSRKEFGENISLEEWISCLGVSSDGLFLAAGLSNGKVVLLDAEKREVMQTIDVHSASVSALAFTEDGTRVVTTGEDGIIGLLEIDAEKGTFLSARLAGHEGGIRGLALAPQGDRFYTGCADDRSTRLWEMPSSPTVNLFTCRATKPLAIKGDILIAWARKEGFVRINLSSGERALVPEMSLPSTAADGAGHGGHSVNPDPLHTLVSREEWLALGEASEIAIWNMKSGEKERSLAETGFRQRFGGADVHRIKRPFAFSPDGSFFATANEDSGLRLWNCEDWSFEELVPEFRQRSRLCFSLDNSALAAFTQSESHAPDRGIVVDLQSRQIIAEIGLSSHLLSIAISSDGSTLAAGLGNHRIELWDLSQGVKRHSLEGHLAGVFSLAFSPDGRTLASTGDNRLILWNVESGSELTTLIDGRPWLRGLLFSPDGRYLTCYIGNDELGVWHAPSWEELKMSADGYGVDRGAEISGLQSIE
jgi:WD40 repeat protein/tRNA A-37 threonylcarbamoyl transferase component Bud32